MAGQFKGLGSLQTQNPYDRQSATTAGMMDRSGFAKPLLALSLGKGVGAAKKWDEDQAAAHSQQSQEAILKQDANDLMKHVIAIGKTDPVAATELLNKGAAQNPHLEKFQGLKFNTTIDPAGVVKVTDENGKLWLVNIAKILNGDKSGAVPVEGPTMAVEDGKDGKGGEPRAISKVLNDIKGVTSQIETLTKPGFLEQYYLAKGDKASQNALVSMYSNKRDSQSIKDLLNTRNEFVMEWEERTGRKWGEEKQKGQKGPEMLNRSGTPNLDAGVPAPPPVQAPTSTGMPAPASVPPRTAPKSPLIGGDKPWKKFLGGNSI